MRVIVVQMARLLASLVVLYGLMLAGSLLLVPPTAGEQRLNTARAGSSLFLTEPKYVFMARSQLNNTNDKVLLLGASNVFAGFRQEQVQALVPEAEVHSLAVGGSNMTQISQVVDLVREVQTPAARQHNTYVIGLWYGLFADDKARWYTPDRHGGDTDIDIERYRYGFYRRTESGPVPLLPPRDLETGALLIHPYLVMDRATRDATQSLRNLLSGKPPAITDAERNAVVISDAERRKYLAFWREYMGSIDKLSDAPFRTLERMVDGILAEGGQVVLVDLPIPAWHSQGSPLAADYRARMNQALLGLDARSGVAVLRMDDQNDDANFEDEVHPKPRVAPLWAEQLAATLNAHATLRHAQAANDIAPNAL
jgi:hypothetical protein